MQTEIWDRNKVFVSNSPEQIERSVWVLVCSSDLANREFFCESLVGLPDMPEFVQNPKWGAPRLSDRFWLCWILIMLKIGFGYAVLTGVEDILLWKKNLENFPFLTLPLEIRTKQSSPPWKFHKIVLNPWKFQGQKPAPMEIRHYFFFITTGNSTSFLINPWKFHMLFPHYPRNFHAHNLPVWIFSGIAHFTYYCEDTHIATRILSSTVDHLRFLLSKETFFDRNWDCLCAVQKMSF